MKEIFDKSFPGVGGSAVLLQGSQVVRYGEKSDVRRVPCSTFKIVLAHLALEHRLVQSSEEVWKFTGKKSGRSEWDRNLSLRTALETSAEWFFQDVARKLGPERFRAGVKKFGYGSGWTGTDPTLAWHDGSITIAPTEQVLLMLRLQQETLPFATGVQRVVKRCLTYPVPGGKVTLWGKTGSSGKEADGKALGWYVGAFHLPGETPMAFAILRHDAEALGPKVRQELVRRLGKL